VTRIVSVDVDIEKLCGPETLLLRFDEQRISISTPADAVVSASRVIVRISAVEVPEPVVKAEAGVAEFTVQFV
jgi:hypothetical protein